VVRSWSLIGATDFPDEETASSRISFHGSACVLEIQRIAGAPLGACV